MGFLAPNAGGFGAPTGAAGGGGAPHPLISLGLKLLDLLSRPGSAVEAGVARGPGALGETLWQGTSPYQHEADRDTIKNALGIKALVDLLPEGFARGTADTVLDAGLDPLTYLGGSGLIARGANAAGRAGYVGGAKALGAMSSMDPDAFRGLGAAANKTGEVLQGLHNFVSPGGPEMGQAKLRLAQQYGGEGLDQYSVLRAFKKMGDNTSNAIANAQLRKFETAAAGLSDDQQMALFHLLGGNGAESLPENLRSLVTPDLEARAAKVGDVWKGLDFLQGTKTARDALSGQGFTLPEELQPFAESVRGMKNQTQIGPRFTPNVDEPISDLMEGLGPQVADPAAIRRAIRSEAGAIGSHDMQQKLIEYFAKPSAVNSMAYPAREAAGTRAAQEAIPGAEFAGKLGMNDVPYDIRSAALAESAKKASLNPGDPGYAGNWLLDAMRYLTRGTTSAMFIAPANPHYLNEASLGLLSDPLGTLGATAKWFGSGRWLPTSGARDAVQSMPIIGELNQGVQDSVARALSTGAHTLGPERAGAFDNVPGLGQLSRESGRALWDYADTLRGTAYDRNLAMYSKMHPNDPTLASAKAAERVGQDLVDYGDRSALNQSLSNILPFATYATKKPGIVARAAVRNPERVLALARNDPNFQPETKKMEGFEAGRPLASVFRGANDPMTYLQGAAGAPIRDVLSALGAHNFTYGDPGRKDLGWLKLLLTQSAGNVPLVGSNPIPGQEQNTLLNFLGLNYFKR